MSRWRLLPSQSHFYLKYLYDTQLRAAKHQISQLSAQWQEVLMASCRGTQKKGWLQKRWRGRRCTLLHGVQIPFLHMIPNYYNTGEEYYRNPRDPTYLWRSTSVCLSTSLLLNSTSLLLFTRWLGWYLKGEAPRKTMVSREIDYYFQNPLIYYNSNKIL